MRARSAGTWWILAAAVLLVGGYLARVADLTVMQPAAQAAAVQPSYEPRQPSTSG